MLLDELTELEDGSEVSATRALKEKQRSNSWDAH